MGRQTPTGPELGDVVLANTGAGGVQAFTAAAQTSGPLLLKGDYAVVLSGTFVAIVVIEVSYDGGATWVPVLSTATGTAVALSAPGVYPYRQGEAGVLTRLRCSSLTSGTVTWRVSR